MNFLHLVVMSFSAIFTLISTPTNAELISDPYFDDPASWDIGIGSSIVENGHLVVINHSGFIFPEPRLATEIGSTYQYTLTVDLVNNTSGGGMVTVGGQTIWEPIDATGIFTGTVMATNTGGLVFNFLDPYLGRAEFDFVSIVVATPIPPSVWLFGTGVLGLVAIARRRKAA